MSLSRLWRSNSRLYNIYKIYYNKVPFVSLLDLIKFQTSDLGDLKMSSTFSFLNQCILKSLDNILQNRS